MLKVMRRWLLRESVWLSGSILAAGLTVVVVALANDAPTALDVFAGFVVVVGGIAIYVVAASLRLALWAFRPKG